MDIYYFILKKSKSDASDTHLLIQCCIFYSKMPHRTLSLLRFHACSTILYQINEKVSNSYNGGVPYFSLGQGVGGSCDLITASYLRQYIDRRKRVKGF